MNFETIFNESFFCVLLTIIVFMTLDIFFRMGQFQSIYE